MIKFLGKEKENQTSEELNKQLNIQHAQIFKLAEDIRELNKKVDQIYSILQQLQNKPEVPIVSVIEQNDSVSKLSKKDKTRDAIKLILKRKGKMTSEELCKIIGLSRTRCNEYLKELERDKEAKSEIIDRKKYYRIV